MTASLPGLTRQSIALRTTLCEDGWIRGSSPRMTPCLPRLQSYRRRAQHMRAAAGRYRTAGKESCRNFGPAEILDIAKTQRRQPRMKHVAVKMVAELFAYRRDPRDQRLMHGAPAPLGHRIRRIDIIEHDMRAARQSGDEAERRKDRVLGEIRYDTEPCEKRLLRGIEPGRGKAVRQCLSFEIDRNEAERGGQRDACLGQPRALPGLCRGMIDLEDAQVLRGQCAISGGVEPGAEHDELTRAAFHGRRQRIVGYAAAHRNEPA